MLRRDEELGRAIRGGEDDMMWVDEVGTGVG